jgi:hypothetical protein
VTVLEQVGSNEGDIWKYVQFSGSSQLKGWIREEFLASDIQKNIQKNRQAQNGSNQHSSFQKNQGYLGDRHLTNKTRFSHRSTPEIFRRSPPKYR